MNIVTLDAKVKDKDKNKDKNKDTDKTKDKTVAEMTYYYYDKMDHRKTDYWS